MKTETEAKTPFSELMDDQEQKQTEATQATAEGYDEQDPDSQPVLEGQTTDGSEPINEDLPGGGEGLVEAEEVETEEPTEGITEAENQLIKIQNQLLVVREKESVVDELKDDLKTAKASYENAVEQLLHLAQASKNDENRPLFDQPKEDAGCNPEAQSEDAWKTQPIETLWADEPIKGLGAKKLEDLIDHCPTLNDLEILRVEAGNNSANLSTVLPKGIGDAMADEIEKRHLDFVANFSPTPEPAEVEEAEPEPEAFSLKAFVDGLIAEDGWELKSNVCDAFEQGKEDFLNGQSIEDLQPAIMEQFEEGSEDLTQWVYGWGFASAEFEAETSQPEEEYEDVLDSEDELADL